MKRSKIEIFLIVMLLISVGFSSGTGLNQSVKATEQEACTSVIDTGGQESHPLATDYFYMDFKPDSALHSVDGGRFENDEAWTTDKQVTNDDFDNTPDFDWTNSKGIYSAVRHDEDLWDSTSVDGAWCSCAKEHALFVEEDSRGWASVEKTFDIDDFIDTSTPNLCFTNVTLLYDYWMHSSDFDDGRSYVYFIVYIDDGREAWPCYVYWVNENNAPNDGYCTDVWDPSLEEKIHKMKSRSNDPLDTKFNDNELYKYTKKTYGGNNVDSEDICTLFNTNLRDYDDTTYTLRFKLLVRCYGAVCSAEQYKFWVDNVRMKCSYYYNNPPNEPSSPTPSDGAINQDINVDVSWTGGDPDTGDTVTYDVYFEADDSSPDQLVSDDQPGTSYDPGALDYQTQYYWKIVAKDSAGKTKEGDIWDFTTGSRPNNPPNTPSKPYKNDNDYSGYTETSYTFKTEATDPNSDQIRYGWDWDGDNTVDEWTGFSNSGDTISQSHSWSSTGSFDIKVKAKDDRGKTSSWSSSRTFKVTEKPNDPPIAYIDSISPNPAQQGQSVSFEGHGSDPDGSIAGYQWRSSIDGTLSTASSFSESGLSIGVHTIYFKVKDDDGRWSSEVSKVLPVNYYFVHITDPHVIWGSSDRWERIIDKINSFMYQPKFVLCSGDNVDWGEGLSGSLNYNALTNHLYRKPSDPDWYIDPGRHVKIFFTPGNHDYRYGHKLAPPYSLFNYDSQVFPDTFYSTTIGKCAIFSIDSGHDFWPWGGFPNPLPGYLFIPEGAGLSQSHLESLELDLDLLDGSLDEQDTSDYMKIIMMHHPSINPEGGGGDMNDGVFWHLRDEFKQICQQYNVHLVTSGHLHQNLSWDLDGYKWNSSSTGTRCIITKDLKRFYALRKININFIPALGDSFVIDVHNEEYLKSSINMKIQCQVNTSIHDDKGHYCVYNASSGGFDNTIPGGWCSNYLFNYTDQNIDINDTSTELSVDRDTSTSYTFNIDSTKNETMNLTIEIHLKNGMSSTAYYKNVTMYNGSKGIIYANNSLTRLLQIYIERAPFCSFNLPDN